MAWDASRPVPWQRLTREWLIYVAVMAALFVAFFRSDNLVGIFAGLLVSGPLYLGFGFVLAKFGYSRKSWKELRSQPSGRGASRRSGDASNEAVGAGPRPKPPPTSRTGGGPQRPGGKRKRR